MGAYLGSGADDQGLRQAIAEGDVTKLRSLVEGCMQFNHQRSEEKDFDRSENRRVVNFLLRTGPDNTGKIKTDVLHVACKRGVLDTVRLLAEEAQVPVNTLDEHGCTPLWYATEGGHVDVVRMLLRAGAAPDLHSATKHLFDSTDCSPLVCAVNAGHADIVSELIDHGARVSQRDACGKTPLHIVAATGDEPIADILLACSQADVSAVDKDGVTPLHIACRRGSLPLVQRLLQAGCDANIATNSKAWFVGELRPLHFAVIYNHPDIVLCLCQRSLQQHRTTAVSCTDFNRNTECPSGSGKHQSCTYVDLDSLDSYGRTPLSHASESGSEKASRLLIDFGCNVTIPDSNGDTALVHACKHGWSTIAQLIVESNREGINVAGADSRTPLHHASHKGNALLCSLLLKHGAFFNRHDEYGVTALDYAVFSGHYRTARCLLLHGHALPSPTHQVSKVLRVVSTLKRFKVLNLLLLFGWKPNVDTLGLFVSILSQTEGGTEALALLQETLSTPASLQKLCRSAIRQSLVWHTQARTILPLIRTLPLPQTLKSFIEMCDITE